MKHPNDHQTHRNAADPSQRGNNIRTAPAATPVAPIPAVTPDSGPVIAAPAVPAPAEKPTPAQGAKPGESRGA